MYQDLSVIPEIPAAQSQIDPLYEAAEVLLSHKDYDNLKNIAANILQRDSSQSRAIFYLCKYFEKHEQYANQEKCLEKLLKLELNAKSIFEYANFLYARNRLDEAIQIIQENIQDIQSEKESDYFDLYRLMGNISLKLADVDTAEEYYNICLRINPKSDVVYTNLGSLFLHKGNHSKSIDQYQKALAINSKNSKAWLGLAICHLNQKDAQLFWGNVRNALDCNPFDSKTIEIALNQALADFEYDVAVTAAEVYLQENPFDLKVSTLFASLLFQIGDFNKAILEITKILSFDPENESATRLYTLIEAENVKMAK
ncbi:MAG: tetratricopeptide repeat protein [Bdellovibrionales bacterium]|nr:tetratricopeptide repeat protein [Bdellovibrionales bacterium]